MTMLREEYVELRAKSDRRSFELIEAEAREWNQVRIQLGSARRSPHENFNPGDTIMYPADAYETGLLF